MRQSASAMRLGTFLGAPIFVTWSWLLFVLVIVPLYTRQMQGWLGTAPAIALSVVLALMWGASVLLHELGHVAAARALRFDVERVEIGFLGGATTVRSTHESPRSELLVSAAGPAVSLAIGLPGAVSLISGNGLAFGLTGVAGMLVSAITLANLAIGAFNLLPGLPLDGGRIAVAALWKLTGDQPRAIRIASYLGQAIAALLAGYAMYRVMVSAHPTDEIPWVLALAIMSATLWGMAATSRHSAQREATLAARRLVDHVMPVVTLSSALPAAAAARAETPIILVRHQGSIGYVDRAVAAMSGATLGEVSTPLAEHRVLPEEATALDLLHRLREHGAPWLVVIAADGTPLGIVGAQALTGQPVALSE